MNGYWQLGLIIAFLLTAVIGIPAAVFGPGYLRHREQARLRAEGVPAMARILAIEDTGNRFNAMPEVIIRVEVTAAGRPSWAAQFHRVMEVQDIQFFTTGRVIPIRYDPTAPGIVAYSP